MSDFEAYIAALAGFGNEVNAGADGAELAMLIALRVVIQESLAGRIREPSG